MKTRNFIYLAIAILCAAGCQPYGDTRPEIKGNGQGGIDLRRVSNDPPPPPLPPPTTVPVPSTQQDEIEALQAQLRARDEEIRRLKQAPTTQP